MEPPWISEDWAKRRREDECNVRSAKRGERRGEREEKIERNVQACKLKSSAQKVSQHRLRDLNFEAQIVPECLPKGPLETLWTHLGQPLGARGALLGDLGAPGTLFGAPRELVGAPRELFGCSGGGFRSSRGRFWKHFGMMFETFFCPCCACCGSQHLALFWSFLGRSGVHRSRSSQNGRDRSRLVNTI